MYPGPTRESRLPVVDETTGVDTACGPFLALHASGGSCPEDTTGSREGFPGSCFLTLSHCGAIPDTK